MPAKKKSNYLLLLPIAGAILFLFFYYIATLNYPGGSQTYKHSKGFSWLHNYWCNLLNENAINGQPNAGRTYAMAGMLLLYLSLGWFWYFFALYMQLKKSYRIVWNIEPAAGYAKQLVVLWWGIILFTRSTKNYFCLFFIVDMPGMLGALSFC